MKRLLVIILVIIAFESSAQQINYKEWQDLAKENINLNPEYGNAQKKDDYIKLDKDFIELAIKTDGTPQKASEHMVSLGFSYMYRGDLKTAMRRFNQAWLLNSKNENAYWGFGAVYFTLGATNEAIAQYNKGLKLNPYSSNILTDKATIYLNLYYKNNAVADKQKAIDLFNTSYKIDPKNQNTLYKLSVLYFNLNDCVNANRYFKECKALGGQPIAEDYEVALRQKCKN